jgi:hypothetical protein
MTLNLNELARGGTVCFSKAGLAEGTNDYTLLTAAPNGAGIDFAINGIFYHLADGDNIAMPACATQGLLTTCLYLVCLNSSGTLSITKGREVLTADLTAGNAVLQFPGPPANECPIGYFRIACESTATFTSGSTDLSAANITETYFDLFSVPVAPLTS